MTFDTEMLELIKKKITILLCSFYYDYYVDILLSITDPKSINIVTYPKTIDTARKRLIDHGFSVVNNTTHETYGCITMIYKDIITVKILTNKDEYKRKKNENTKITKITLHNVVKKLVKQEYSISSIRATLLELAEHN